MGGGGCIVVAARSTQTKYVAAQVLPDHQNRARRGPGRTAECNLAVRLQLLKKPLFRRLNLLPLICQHTHKDLVASTCVRTTRQLHEAPVSASSTSSPKMLREGGRQGRRGRKGRKGGKESDVPAENVCLLAVLVVLVADVQTCVAHAQVDSDSGKGAMHVSSHADR